MTINGKTTSQFEITLVSADAIVNVESLTTTGVFIVTVDIKDTTSDPILGTAGIRLSAEGKNSIGGVVIVATTYTVTNDVYNAAQVSGEVTAANSTEPVGDNVVNPNTALTVFGYTIVSEDLKIGSYTGFNFGGKTAVANVIVSGNMQVSNVADIFTGSEVTVTGMLQTGTVDLEKKSGLAINAASYRVATTDAAGKSVYNYYYTTLENTIASEVKQINVLGKITVGSDISVPNGTTITQKNGKITVSEDATLTFVSGSKLVQSGQYDASEYEGVDVEGTLYFENASTGYSKNNVWIYSEVFSTDGTDALYTSLVNAMEAAESGTTIELYNKNVTIEKTSFTIKEGVTVDTKGKDFEVLGSTLTIDGTLYVNGGNYTVSDITENNYTYKASVVLNGYIKSNVAMTYNVDNKAYPAGAYYSITTSGITTYYLTTVTNAATLINTVDGSKITISGENIIGDVEFTGTEDVQATIVLDVTAKVTAGTVMLSYATISFEGGDFVGTIANANGSFAFDDDVTFTATTVSADVNKDGNDVLAATGALLNGTVTADGTVNLGNSSNIDKLVVIGTVNIEGSSTIGILTVNGTVNILAGGAAGIDTAYVFGELTTAVATAESSGTGSATISKLYVGVMVQGTDEHIVDGNAGSISGNVTVSGTAYVSADSVVPESISNATGKYATGFYVEDALWLTAYGTSANVPNAPVTDAEFLGWYDPADEKQNRVDTDGTISSLATYGRLDAKINIYVYNVGVITDGTIGSVAIDGVILGNNGANGFVTTKPLAAGTHTLDYTLKSGYEGTATMTIDGQAVSGNDFTLSGDYGTPDDVDLTIYLSGPTPVSSGEIVINNGSDDMSLTNILLIVLVVLIVIMAIIVALRLMRS